MYKFIAQILTFFTLFQLIIWALLYNFPLRFFDELQSLTYHQKQVCESVKNESLDYLFIGNSQILNALDKKAFPNARILAVAGGSYFEIHKMLSCYLKNNDPKNIIISPSPTMGFWPYTFWKVNSRYFYYSFEEMIEMSQVLSQKGSYKSINGSEVMASSINGPMSFYKEVILNKIAFITRSITTFQSIIKENRYPKNQKAFAALQNNSGFYFLDGYERFSDAIRFGLKRYQKNNKTFKFDPLQEYYLRKTLSLVRTKEKKVLFMTMPVQESDHKLFSKTYFKEYREEISRIDNQGSMKIIDIKSHYPDKMFLDTIHFNKLGKKEFSKNLAGILND